MDSGIPCNGWADVSFSVTKGRCGISSCTMRGNCGDRVKDSEGVLYFIYLILRRAGWEGGMAC